MHTLFTSDPDLKLGQIALWSNFITHLTVGSFFFWPVNIKGSMPFQESALYYYYNHHCYYLFILCYFSLSSRNSQDQCYLHYYSNVEGKTLFCSPSLHFFDQIYSKNSNSVTYNHNVFYLNILKSLIHF